MTKLIASLIGLAFVVAGLAADTATPAPKPLDPAAVKPLEAVLDKALAGYNAGAQATFFADFAKSARPPANDATWTRLIDGYYRAEFGRVLTKKLSQSQTQPDADFGMLVYHTVTEKVRDAKLSANFVRENGALKIVQIRIEKVEPVK